MGQCTFGVAVVTVAMLASSAVSAQTIFVKHDSTPTGETAWKCELDQSDWMCLPHTGNASYDRDCTFKGTQSAVSDWECLGAQIGETHWYCIDIGGEWKCDEQ